MKITDKQYNLFRKECEKWLDKFELNNWTVYFMKGKLDKLYGRTEFNLQDRWATITLSDEIKTIGKSEIDEKIKRVAKHEVIHLLIGRLEKLGNVRFLNQDEYDEAAEELVVKLSNIIKD